MFRPFQVVQKARQQHHGPMSYDQGRISVILAIGEPEYSPRTLVVRQARGVPACVQANSHTYYRNASMHAHTHARACTHTKACPIIAFYSDYYDSLLLDSSIRSSHQLLYAYRRDLVLR